MSERVWWCLQHGSVFAEGSESDMCDDRILDQAIGFELTPCAMVERLLIDPVSTLIVEKGEDGFWPDVMFRAVADEIMRTIPGVVAWQTPVTEVLAGHWAGRFVGAALDALKEQP